MGRQKTTLEFITDANKVHGDKYDYSKTVYNKAQEKVIITCPIHGDFEQTPNSHLMGRGCPKCGLIMAGENISKAQNIKECVYKTNKKLTNEEVIKRFNEKHGAIYDYNKVNYNGLKEKVCIICPEHGEFWMTPTNHLNGQGCPICAIEKRRLSKLKTTDTFISEANKVHCGFYSYDKSIYTKARNKVIITCPVHGDFKQTPDNHVKKRCGCPTCQNSSLENEIYRVLCDNNIDFIEQYTFDELSYDKIHKQRIDFFLPKYNIGIECQGIQHFKPYGTFGSKKITIEDFYEKVKELDKRKYDICTKHGIDMIYFTHHKVKDYQWNLFFNTDDVLTYINTK